MNLAFQTFLLFRHISIILENYIIFLYLIYIIKDFKITFKGHFKINYKIFLIIIYYLIFY